MKSFLVLIFTSTIFYAASQTVEVRINPTYVEYNTHHKKAFVAVSHYDNIYPNMLLQLDPYNGEVEKSLQLSEEPNLFRFTSDHQHLYLIYKYSPRITKVNVADFEIVETMQIDEYEIEDFAISPFDENTLIIIKGDGGYPEGASMYKGGVEQPKRIGRIAMSATAVSIHSDGTRLYAHTGYGSGHDGWLVDVLEDGIVTDSVAWHYMVPSFGRIRNHNDLVFGKDGFLVDPFSDSIPLREAFMPVYKISDGGSGFDYSQFHGCYIFGHRTLNKGYISFFHGNHYNYLGSLQLDGETDYIRDVDVVDENHFILISNDRNSNDDLLLFHSADSEQQKDRKIPENVVNEKWLKSINLIELPFDNRELYDMGNR